MRNCLLEAGYRLLYPVQLVERVSQVIVDLRIAGRERERFAKTDDCLLPFAGLQKHVSEALDRLRKIGLDGQRPGNAYRSFDQISLLLECIAEPEVCPFQLGIEGCSLTIVGDGLV